MQMLQKQKLHLSVNRVDFVSLRKEKISCFSQVSSSESKII